MPPHEESKAAQIAPPRAMHSLPCAHVERRVTVAACFLRQGAGNETLADPGRSEYENVLVIGGPGRRLRQGADHAFVESPRSAIVDVFHRADYAGWDEDFVLVDFASLYQGIRFRDRTTTGSLTVLINS